MSNYSMYYIGVTQLQYICDTVAKEPFLLLAARYNGSDIFSAKSTTLSTLHVNYSGNELYKHTFGSYMRMGVCPEEFAILYGNHVQVYGYTKLGKTFILYLLV